MAMPDELDYEALGFKCGLEIHQQLVTERKLFCRCGARLRRDEPHASILRHMRPTLSEMGTYDGTALMEFKTKKNVIYQLYEDGVCTYEMDDTPPFPINEEALDISLEVALLMNCSIVDEVHVSRKQYLDGSIPTGFQRTAIIGVEGSVPFKGRQLGIIQLSVEEDACREVSDKGHLIVFKTDRLSIPLVEVVTKAEIRCPSEVPEAAEHLGRLMRATGKVRRGLGATRQDVNVSITGGTRVEIKGVPKLQWMEALTRNEAIRQRSLLEMRDILRSRGVTDQTLSTQVKDLTHLFAGTQCPYIAKALEQGGKVKGIKLCGFGGLLGREVMPGVPLSNEFAGRVKVIACLDDPVNIVHTEELPIHGLGEKDKEAIEGEMHDRHFDVTVLAWGPNGDVDTAMKEIKLRALDALNGVPSETRQAFADGTSGFERILPGPDRMYPDTDSPPTAITEQRIQKTRERLTEPPWTAEERFASMGVPRRLARELALSPRSRTFDALVKAGHPAKGAAVFLVEGLKALRRAGVDVDRLTGEDIKRIFDRARGNGMSPTVLPKLALAVAKGVALEGCGIEPVSDAELLEAARSTPKGSDAGVALGHLMARFRGRVSAGRARKALSAK
jgi:glutamyl-tRNA(Gln) amidotransferase subunit E